MLEAMSNYDVFAEILVILRENWSERFCFTLNVISSTDIQLPVIEMTTDQR